MSIHAVDKNMQISNIKIDYRDRPQGSESKLNTYADGIRVLKTIGALYKNYKPMQFFSWLACFLLVVAAALFAPVLATYVQSGLVPRFPTLITCGFIVLAALLSFFSGMILETIAKRGRQEFEMRLHDAWSKYRELTEENGLSA